LPHPETEIRLDIDGNKTRRNTTFDVAAVGNKMNHYVTADVVAA